jgi:hypothetical protein
MTQHPQRSGALEQTVGDDAEAPWFDSHWADLVDTPAHPVTRVPEVNAARAQLDAVGVGPAGAS